MSALVLMYQLKTPSVPWSRFPWSRLHAALVSLSRRQLARSRQKTGFWCRGELCGLLQGRLHTLTAR